MRPDPYRYFRIEARELAEQISRGLLEIEKGGSVHALVAQLLRHAHTLKGAARVVKRSRVAELAHAFEELLEPFRDQADPIPREKITGLFGLLDAIEADIQSLGAPSELRATPDATAPAGEEAIDSVRVDISALDRLLDFIARASVALDGLQRNARETRDSSTRASDVLEAGLAVMEREFEQARELIHGLRLVPVRTIQALLERTARDAAESLGKQVRFELRGGDIHIDAHVLAALREALLHIIRNAVAHGIESGPRRSAAGKDPIGLVSLSVARDGQDVVFACRDDGCGLDLEAARAVLSRRGVLDPAQAASLGHAEALELIFRGGISTTRTVTEISGRGIGIEIVRKIVADLKGELRAISGEAGAGLCLEIRVPVTLASIVALAVRAGGRTVWLPLQSIRQVLRVAPGDIARSPEGDSIAYEADTIPFLPLELAVSPRPAAYDARTWSTLIVEANATRAAFGTDRLLGPGNVLLKALPSPVGVITGIAGATFDAEGNPELVLEAGGLVQIAHGRRAMVAAAPARARPPILVIDDSLTTRMLEQSILESAGFAVETAASAEEALEKAQTQRYDLFVVDVEMPGMNGFEFIELSQSHPALTGTPAILVTSRSSPEDRRRAVEVGARAYIVKSEFDERIFLDKIQNLIHSRE
jgi:two-component system chemotaxis sensor kinase CheA